MPLIAVRRGQLFIAPRIISDVGLLPSVLNERLKAMAARAKMKTRPSYSQASCGQLGRAA